MKHLRNTLFVTSEDVYLALDGENVVAKRDDAVLARYPLHTLQNIVTFSYAGASPALMGACVQRDVHMAFCSPRGRFLARVSAMPNGNVLLRRDQYRIADDKEQSCRIARCMISGKLYNARWVLERAKRDHPDRVDADRLRNAILILKEQVQAAAAAEQTDVLRGAEGVGAAAYFGVLDELILRDKIDFFFRSRNRRPPLDRVNALLSFAYALLAHECASALESVGLDAHVGFMHTDRPGRTSLALDLMEELRPVLADRFVLTTINNRILRSDDFLVEDSGAVRLTDSGRKAFLQAWQEKRKETIVHPFLQEKLPWGMIPYVQALLLARYLRGDLDAYPPLLWK